MVAVSLSLGDYPWTAPLLDGEIALSGFELDCADYGGSQQFQQLIRELTYGASEMTLFTYLVAKEQGARCTAIPYFPWWVWPEESITVNRNAGITSPKDLEGKRIAVRTYAHSTGCWLRGLLAHDYDVDTQKMTFVLSSEENVAGMQLPANVELMLGADLAPLVASGELDGAIAIPPADERVVRLFADARQLHDRWRARGVSPIDHCVIIRDDLIEQYPTLPHELYRALLAAQDPFLERLASGQLSKEDQSFVDRADIVGPASIAPGVEANRKTLELAVRFAVEQHLLEREIALEDLFVML